MRTDRDRLLRVAEATAVWLAMSAVFILWQPPPSSLPELAVEIGAMILLLVVVAALSSLALERRLPQLWPEPYDSRTRVMVMAVGVAAFAALLSVWMLIGPAASTIWIIYLGGSYAMTIAGILADPLR